MTSPPGKRPLFTALLVLDLVVTLAPPLYWAAGSGSRAWPLWYFIGGGAVVLATIVVLCLAEERWSR